MVWYCRRSSGTAVRAVWPPNAGHRKPAGAESFTSRSTNKLDRLDLVAPRPGHRQLLQALVRVHTHPGGDLGPRPVGLQLPGQDVVGEVDRQDLVEAGGEGGIGDRDQRLDPLVEVAHHEVGGADVVDGVDAGRPEPVDARVLEVAADD